MRAITQTWQILASATLLFAIVNVLLHLYFHARYNPTSSQSADFYSLLSEPQRTAYRGMSIDAINDMLFWTWIPGFQYESTTGFRETPRTSRYVNVSESSIRLTTGAESDPHKLTVENTVFFFGGSTTFGYGVADVSTIASHLQRLLPGLNVVNMGRGYYYSAQEDELLMKLIQSGVRVRTAVFLDGLNERCDTGVYQAQMGKLFKAAQTRYHWDWQNEVAYPAIRFAGTIANKLGLMHISTSAESMHDLLLIQCRSAYGASVPLRQVVLANMRVRTALCRAFAMTCLSFVQPFAGVHGQHLDHRSLNDEERTLVRERYYELKDAFVEAQMIDVTDALDDLHEHAYVDDVHYSDAASELIASKMAPFIRSAIAPAL
jgi:hypothetical protein